jgi:hypothetical protein
MEKLSCCNYAISYFFSALYISNPMFLRRSCLIGIKQATKKTTYSDSGIYLVLCKHNWNYEKYGWLRWHKHSVISLVNLSVPFCVPIFFHPVCMCAGISVSCFSYTFMPTAMLYVRYSPFPSALSAWDNRRPIRKVKSPFSISTLSSWWICHAGGACLNLLSALSCLPESLSMYIFE